MISVIYCTRESNPKHKEHIIKTSGLYKNTEVIEIINNGESLTSAYNRGYKMASNDIVVFCHDDIIIETKNWGKKLLKSFTNNDDYGIIGVAGSREVPKSGMWWHGGPFQKTFLVLRLSHIETEVEACEKMLEQCIDLLPQLDRSSFPILRSS